MKKQRSTTMRKRGLSNVDRDNIKRFKLNTSASLQQEFEKQIKSKRKKETGKDKFSKPPVLENIKGKPFLNGLKVKVPRGKKRHHFDSSSSTSQGNRSPEEIVNMFSGFDYNLEPKNDHNE